MTLSRLETLAGFLETTLTLQRCPDCGGEQASGEAGVCYLCSSGFGLEGPIELKGGEAKMTQKPVFKERIGSFSSAIFLNERDGRKIPSVVVEKSFTKDGTTWERQKLSLMNASEVDKLICVLRDTKKALYKETFDLGDNHPPSFDRCR
jgi:hypothetical protein